MRSFRSSSGSWSLEAQSVLAGGIGQGGDPAAVGVPTAVEDDGVDASGLGALGDQLTDAHAVGLLVTVDRTHIGFDRRRGGRRQVGDEAGRLYVSDTSRQAAEHVASRAELLRDRCAQRVRQAGAAGLTADEAADALGESVLSIRPRFTELLRLAKIKDSGQRRRNDSGRSAKVWVAA